MKTWCGARPQSSGTLPPGVAMAVRLDSYQRDALLFLLACALIGTGLGLLRGLEL